VPFLIQAGSLVLELVALTPDLITQLDELLPFLFQMGGQLLFLAFEGGAALLKPILFFEQPCLLGSDRSGLHAQRIDFAQRREDGIGSVRRLLWPANEEAERPDAKDVAIAQDTGADALLVDEGSALAAQVAQN
jgi:hypothetical protein